MKINPTKIHVQNAFKKVFGISCNSKRDRSQSGASQSILKFTANKNTKGFSKVNRESGSLRKVHI